MKRNYKENFMEWRFLNNIHYSSVTLENLKVIREGKLYFIGGILSIFNDGFSVLFVKFLKESDSKLGNLLFFAFN